MMKTINKLFILGSIIATATAVHAMSDEDRLLATLKKSYPNTQFTAVSRTPIQNLYEVWMGSNVAFVSSKNVRYLVFGHLFDTTSGQDLTAPKLAKVERSNNTPSPSKVSLSQLPFNDALKTIRGNGSRQIVVFSDPACPYCKRLEPELAKLDNVTIHTFLLPFQGYEKPLAIWCAQTPEQAWHRYMVSNDTSLSREDRNCPNPLDRNMELAKQLGIHGTPTMLLADGQRLEGYSSAAEIESNLNLSTDKVSSSSQLNSKEKQQ